ncbi:MAG: hypothetical protein WCO60_18575 [Verrucomicrobiota bacterium]
MTSTLPANEAPASMEVLALCQEAVTRFKPLCFWFRDSNAPIQTVGDVLLVIRRLRQHGNRETWAFAQKIQQCL